MKGIRDQVGRVLPSTGSMATLLGSYLHSILECYENAEDVMTCAQVTSMPLSRERGELSRCLREAPPLAVLLP